MLGKARLTCFICSATIPVIRLSDNLARLGDGLAAYASALSLPGEYESNLDGAFAAVSPGEGGTGTASVLNTVEPLGQDLPLWSTAWLQGLIYNTAQSWLPDAVSTSGRSLMATSGSTSAYGAVEGFLVNSTCEAVTLSVTPTIGQSLSTFVFQFACGTKAAVYARGTAEQIVVDSYGCIDGTQNVYFYVANPATGEVLYAYKCGIAASSVVVPVVYSAATSKSRTTGPIRTTTALPSTLNLAAFLGSALLNNFGIAGWPNLATRFVTALNQGIPPEDFLSSVVESMSKMTLAKLQATLNQAYHDNRDPPVTRSGSTTISVCSFPYPLSARSSTNAPYRFTRSSKSKPSKSTSPAPNSPTSSSRSSSSSSSSTRPSSSSSATRAKPTSPTPSRPR